MFAEAVKALTAKKEEKKSLKDTVFVGLVHAIVIFKRLAKKIRARRRYRNTRRSVKSALFKKVLESHTQVRDALFGRPVITLSGEAIDDYREYMDRRMSEFKASKEAISSRRHATRPSTFTIPTSIAKREYEHRNQGIPIVMRLRSLNSGIFTDTEDNAVPEEGGTVNSKEDKPPRDTALTSFFQDVVDKNKHLHRINGDDTKARSAALLKADVRTMKKLDVQDALTYNPGTAVYFGATIALQSRHGGFLSFVHGSDIKASAPKLLPSTRFVIWNCDQLNDYGVLRYGDAVWLQAGQHEILGAHYSCGPGTNEMTRQIHPALINCRRNNFFKAQQYGRWIVLNQGHPSEKMGEQVLHHDSILLEQEWYFLGSKTPYDSFMEKKMSFEKVTSGGGMDVFRPSQECNWKVHLVALPSDDNVDNRCRQYLLTEAQTQVRASAKERLQKTATLHIPLRKKLSEHLTEKYVVENALAHKSTQVLLQRNLLKKYDKQLKKGFVDPLKFGRQEMTDTHAHIYNSVDGVHCGRRVLSRRKATTGGRFGGTISAKDLIEEQYWDVAEKVLTDTRSWSELPSQMSRYYARDSKKKEIAARIIQGFFKRWVPNRSWRKTFLDIDFARQAQFNKYGIDKVDRNNRGSHKLVNFTFARQIIGYMKPRPRLEAANSDDENSQHSEPCKPADSDNNNDIRKKDDLPEGQLDESETKEETEEKYRVQKNIENALNANQVDAGNNYENEAESDNAEPLHHLGKVGIIEYDDDHILPHSTGGRKKPSIKFERPESAPEIVMPLGPQEDCVVDKNFQYEQEHLPQVLRITKTSQPKGNPLLKVDSFEDEEPFVSSKTRQKKEKFRSIMDSLIKSEEREYGLPSDVFQGAQGGLSLADSVKFLSISSSKPCIYNGLKAKKRKIVNQKGQK